MIFLVAILICFFISGCSAQTIYSQDQFDEVIERARNEESVNIRLLPGSYHLNGNLKTNSSISIIGLNATISAYTDSYVNSDVYSETPTHYVCRLKTDLNEFSLMVDQNGKLAEISESVEDSILVNKVDSIIAPEEMKKGAEIILPITDNLTHLKNKTFQKAFGYFDCGWSRICFKLKTSDDRFLYCETLNSTNVPRYDYEKSAYKNAIRFVLYNVEVKPNAIYFDNDLIYIPKSIEKLNVKNCNVFADARPEIEINGDVTISGVTFEGFNGIRIKSGVHNSCNIMDCEFKHTLGNVLSISKKSEFDFTPAYVTRCKFEECSLLTGTMLNLSSSYVGKKSVFVDNCEFVRYPDAKVRYKNTSAMVNVNADAHISDCRFWNTCRAHLYFTKGNSVSKDNIIYNTPDFNTPRDRNLSNDWGLIYIGSAFKNNEKSVSNHEHKVFINECFLYGARANAKDARGIMIDNGRGDIVCRNNVVLDCQSYTLDSRDRKKFIGTSSIRNVFENNILGGRYRLAGGDSVPKKDRPVSRNNILLGVYKNVFNDNANIESSNKVIPVDYKVKDGFIYVGNSEYDSLHKFSSFEKVKKYIIKK